jgi:hypothetical protein
MIFEISEDSGLRMVRDQKVRTVAPLRSTTAIIAARLSNAERESELIPLRLEIPGGRVVFRGVSSIPRWVRGEFHGAAPGDDIQGSRLTLPTRHFVVRVPDIPESDLILSVQGTEHRFALGDVKATSRLSANTSHHVFSGATATSAGDPANRVDLLVLGDGYTIGQAGKFSSDAAAALSGFFSITPYAEYANYVNVHTLFVPSTQVGADHPPYNAGCAQTDPSCCSDLLMLSDPLRGTFVNTAFDARYCSYGIHRLLTVDAASVFAAASAVPDWDQILVIVNDTTYGGSGGTPSVFSLDPLGVEIAQHEYGHTFTRLADEYDDAYPGYPACSDIVGPACEPNVTDQSTRALIKWLPWIFPATPTPTPETFTYAGVVGLFEGARYRPSGFYRPGLDCLMRSLGQPFCPVATQAYILRLYEGGWGIAPEFGIDMIEPGTESPSSQTVHVQYPATVNFSAAILQPIGGPPAQIRWYVNEVLVPGAQTPSYQLSASGPADVTVRLDVTDATNLVHPAMAGSLLTSSREWTVGDPDDDNDAICDSGGPLADGTPGTPPGGCAPGPRGTDNCPTTPNSDQQNFDSAYGDIQGDACDLEDDSDGYPDTVEGQIGTLALDNCGNAAALPPHTFPTSSAWPADLRSEGGSANDVDISDLASFTNPIRHLNTAPGNPNFHSRWDLVPGGGITIIDLANPTVTYPLMLGGATKAFNGPACVP